MKKNLAVCLLASTSTFAATIKFSEELVPLQVNDTKVEQSFFRSVDQVELGSGQHKLKIKYKDLYEIDYDEHEVIESKPFWVVVDVTDNNAEYFVSMPRPDDIEQAKEYVAKPFANIKRVGANGSVIKLEPLTEQVVLAKKPAAITAVAATPVSKTSDVSNGQAETKIKSQELNQEKAATPINQQPSALSMLEFWWSQASESEKQSFLMNKKGN